MTTSYDEEVMVALRVFIACILFGSGAAKFWQTPDFTELLAALGATWKWLGRRFARFLGFVECVISASLLSGTMTKAALDAALGMLVAFAVATLLLIRRDFRGSCHCFGNGSSVVGVSSLITSTTLLAATTCAEALAAKSPTLLAAPVWRMTVAAGWPGLASFMCAGIWIASVFVFSPSDDAHRNHHDTIREL